MPNILLGVTVPEEIPTGIIEYFSGTLATIPSGWALCDGTLGTPDLRARFVRGVATAVTNPGALGGADNVSLSSSTIASHNHTIVSYTHTHQFTGATGAGSGGIRRTATGTETDTQRTTNNSPPNQNLIGTGANGSHENRPPFFELAYIMKVA